MLLSIAMVHLETSPKHAIYEKSLNKLKIMKNKREELMEYHITKCRRDLLYLKDNSTGPNRSFWKTTRLKKPWKCIKSFTNGIKLSRSQKKNHILM